MTNIFIFPQVFPHLPDNTKTLEVWRSLALKGQYPGTSFDPDLKEMLNEIKGFLIDFPRDFLRCENLSPKMGDAEFVVPRVTFV
jgi:hypothetical protein